jgi:hypothetical protein
MAMRWYRYPMLGSDVDAVRHEIGKRRGAGAVPVMVRLLPEQATTVDAWRAKQTDRPGRPEAIRRLIEQALAGKGATRPPRQETARKASKLAARELETLSDQSQPVAEQQRRKRTLIRGPKEFRDIRADLPKTKG